MKTYKEFITEQSKTVKYAGHDYYGSPAKKVLARRSSSSAGGDAGGGGDGGGAGGGGSGGAGLEETTKLSKIHRELEKGGQIGTVSPETGATDTKSKKKEAHKKMQGVLRKLSDKGLVSFTGPHKGRYKYSGTDEPAKEGSYVLKPGSHPKAQKHFGKILKAVGSRFDQESVLKVDKKQGALHYTGGKRKGEVEPKGKIRYNKELTYDKEKDEGSGDTQIKGKNASFTVKE